MKKLLTLMLLIILTTTVFQVTAAPAKEDFLGEWKFESPHAPYGYNKGSIVISEKEGALAGEIKFIDGTKIEAKNIKFDEGVLNFSISVEYNNIPVKATIEGNKMKGTANTPEGNLPFEAIKVEKTE